MEDSYQERIIAIRRRVSGEAPAVIYTSLNRSPGWFFKWWARYEKYGPYRQPQRNGSLENFNGLFQRLVLKTQKIDDFQHLQKEVAHFEEVANPKHPHIPLKGKTSLEYERSVHFVPMLLEEDFTFNSRFKFEEPPEGKVSFICRIRKSGRITSAS